MGYAAEYLALSSGSDGNGRQENAMVLLIMVCMACIAKGRLKKLPSGETAASTESASADNTASPVWV